ncbi:MAG: hypothetical protein IAE78_15160 [Myxococcus sp.]|nr:hypothetical protein [Myxococcus sp.]
MSPLIVAVGLLVSAPPTGDAAAFEQLKAFEGNWKAGEKENARFVSLRVISNSTAVLEMVTGADRTKVLSAAVYYLEGGRLVLAHYGAGGAPKLEAKPGGKLEFEGRGGPVSSVRLTVKGSALLHETVTTTGKTVLELTREYVDTLK